MTSENCGSELQRRFEYHPPVNEGVELAHRIARDTVASAAHVLDQLLPASREKSLVFTKLEEAMFWANAAIARGQVEASPASAPRAVGGGDDR